MPSSEDAADALRNVWTLLIREMTDADVVFVMSTCMDELEKRDAGRG